MKKRLVIFITLLFALSMQVFAQTREDLKTAMKEDLTQIRVELEEKKKIIVDDFLLEIKNLPLGKVKPSKKQVQNRIDLIQCGFDNIEKAEKMLDEIIKIENEDEFNEKWNKYDEIVFIIKMYYTRTVFSDYNNVDPNPLYLVEKIEELSN
jgi:hypothetical protein